MEEIALGELGMSVLELHQILPRQLFNKINGYRKLEQDNWERTRVQTFLLLSVNFKQGSTITPQEIMPFPWDDEVIKTAKNDAKTRRENASKIWAEIDAQQNK
jgi:hypothetical protein